MELLSVKTTTTQEEATFCEEINLQTTVKPFIEANTVECSLAEMQQHHIIPVYVRDNEPAIAHGEFIDIARSVVQLVYGNEMICSPSIRMSHPVKGRVPEAKNKPASELLEHEKTIYYERMAFAIEVPTIFTEVDGNRLNLTIGGVKSYHLDNLAGRSNSAQHFKVFVGFQNKVCTNMCISTDGYEGDLTVKNVGQLHNGISMLLESFNAHQFSKRLGHFCQYQLTEQQFAQLIGRCRMYQYLPSSQKLLAGNLQFGDSHINTVCRDYYADQSFCRSSDGSISLWKLYNLLTGANKSSYIDSFTDRGVNAYELTRELQTVLERKTASWFLN